MKKKHIILFTILILLLVCLIFVNLRAGSADSGISEILKAFFGEKSSTSRIIINIRLPRILAAIFLGGALSLSGYLLQSFFSNPIAGPFVLGISSSAKLLVAILMVISCNMRFPLTSLMMVSVAFVGALVSTIFVLLVSRKVKSMSILIVCGIMVGYICSAITELIVSFAADSNIVNLHNWAMGSFAAISLGNSNIFIPISIVGLIISFLLTKNIEAFNYGEDYAFSLGINIKRFRLILILVSSLLSATVTAYAGPISFVGIAVPHLIRVIFKTSSPKIMVTASFLGGASFCLLCDLIARTMFVPTELSISTITAIFGAPVVIFMLLSRKREY